MRSKKCKLYFATTTGVPNTPRVGNAAVGTSVEMNQSLPLFVGSYTTLDPIVTMTSSQTASQTELEAARVPLGWRDQCSA